MSTQAERWQVFKTEPYTNEEIAACECVRCGAPAVHQWNVCADKNRYRALCLDCDIALNLLVLQWGGDPNAKRKCTVYGKKERKIEGG